MTPQSKMAAGQNRPRHTNVLTRMTTTTTGQGNSITLCCSVLVTLLITGAALFAQDVQYIRAVERAQQQRPPDLNSTARIAPASEPGDPLVVRGRLLTVDGSPAAGAIVFAYQTDSAGLYDRRENGPHSWRLRGWVRTDNDGRFTFETIRPGSYPNSNNPPHVHFTAFMPNGERYHAGELQLSMTRPAGTPSPEEATIALRLEARQRF
jgi:hypothetical protein